MVSSTLNENGDVSPTTKVATTLEVTPGDYRLVGWDMDATGKRLIDEICQIAVYTKDSQYAQYVMPFKNLSPVAKKRHHLKVVTMGRYRVLKNSLTNKVVKTKSEISAITDFVGWLESVRGEAKDGVILVHHEPRRVNPSMLIEALRKYNLLERFKQTVKGFANGFDIAKAKCTDTLNIFSLRRLSQVYLDKEEELSSAADRARLALQLVQHLSDAEEKKKLNEEIGSGDGEQKITKAAVIEFIREFVQSVDAEEKECAELKLVLARQNSLKPIFGPLLNNIARRTRQHASPLRRLLAESAVDYAQLQEAWVSGKREDLEKLLNEKVTADKKRIDDLIEILECHFDPEKKPSPRSNEEEEEEEKEEAEDKKKKKNYNNNNNLKEAKSEMKKSANNNNLSGTESPDTTTSELPLKPKIDEQVPIAKEQVLIAKEQVLTESA